jgi:hypothetical protein
MHVGAWRSRANAHRANRECRERLSRDARPDAAKEADLVLGPGQEGKTIQPEGLEASAMNEKQRAMPVDVIADRKVTGR